MRPAGAKAQEREPIEAVLATERARIDRALAEVGERLLPTRHDPIRPALEYALSTSGKRLRPILFLAAYRVAGEGSCPDAAYRLSCAVEIVHTYSLVHDDLPCMDDDDLRRGRPTVHRVHGIRPATLAGAALLPLAVRAIVEEATALRLETAVAARLVRELCRAAGAAGMVGGQLMDLQAETRRVDGPGLEAIHRAKTGALLTVSLRLGAIAAAADAATLEALSAYGRALGLAFQIADDILDVVGDSEALGKVAGRDEALRKASYPSLYGLDGARAMARARADEAKAALAGIGSPELTALADYVVERRS